MLVHRLGSEGTLFPGLPPPGDDLGEEFQRVTFVFFPLLSPCLLEGDGELSVSQLQLIQQLSCSLGLLERAAEGLVRSSEEVVADQLVPTVTGKQLVDSLSSPLVSLVEGDTSVGATS